MASELVAGVKKTEASLNRLKDRRAAKDGIHKGGGDDGEKGPMTPIRFAGSCCWTWWSLGRS